MGIAVASGSSFKRLTVVVGEHCPEPPLGGASLPCAHDTNALATHFCMHHEHKTGSRRHRDQDEPIPVRRRYIDARGAQGRDRQLGLLQSVRAPSSVGSVLAAPGREWRRFNLWLRHQRIVHS
jgi:hypothetical protein